MSLLHAYAALMLAIALEVVGTSLLGASAQFTRIGPVIGMALCYLLSFYLLALSLKLLPLGVAYAIWSGLGIVLVALIGAVLFGQRLDTPALIGMGLIVAGVLVMNLLSDSIGH